MNDWSNIEISPRDREIIAINQLQESIGQLPENMKRIRELITRFEMCHFKYERHLGRIMDSINDLSPNVDSERIGTSHIQHGEKALQTDTTGRSIRGQQYVWALREWLNDISRNEVSVRYDRKLGQRIHAWLGDKDPDKIQLVRFLLARLVWDWKSYESLQRGGDLADLEFQASRMDICHYAFPQNLELLLQGIGQMKAVEEKRFEGCGSCNARIKAALENEFITLNKSLISFNSNNLLSRKEIVRKWLVACLAKTIKEQIKSSIPMADLKT
jgi:hypothetical protein